MKHNLLLIVLGIIFVFGLILLLIESRANVVKVMVNKSGPTPTIGTEKIYDSDYFNFNYKSKYEIKQIPTTDGRVLENLKISAEDELTLIMSINLTQLSQELSDLSEIQMRRANTWQYSETVARMGEYRGLLFHTADKKEKTAFFKKNNGVLTISMTTNSNDLAYEKEFQDFLDSFEWK